MSRRNSLRKLLMKPAGGFHLHLMLVGLLGLLAGCSSTGGKDSVLGDSSDLSNIPDAVPKVEPKSKYGNPESYVVFGKRYHTKASSNGHVERGLASWYGKKFHGRKTSSGERYDMYAMTAAHKTLPLPTYARVTNLKNGRSAVVKINDRGPFHGDRVIDLSYSAARKLGVVAKGTAMVEIKAIDPRRPESHRQNSFLASADSNVEPGRPARKKAAVVQKTPAPATANPPPRATQASTLVATAEKPALQPEDTLVQVAKKTEPPAPEPKVAAATTADKVRMPMGSSMYLQVGAFGNRMNAEQLRRRLVSNIAEQVQVRTSEDKKAPLYKVRVGPFDSRRNANDLSQQLASLGLKESHIVVE